MIGKNEVLRISEIPERSIVRQKKFDVNIMHQAFGWYFQKPDAWTYCSSNDFLYSWRFTSKTSNTDIA